MSLPSREGGRDLCVTTDLGLTTAIARTDHHGYPFRTDSADPCQSGSSAGGHRHPRAQPGQLTSPTPSPQTLRAEPGDDALLDLDEALGLLEVVFRVLNEDGEANEAWPEPMSAPLPLIPPQDLDLPPPCDDALERVLALLQTDANLCVRLRRELARLP